MERVSNRRILIVGDDIIVARQLAARLGTLGYDGVGIGSSDGAALSTSAEAAPDLLLVDIAPGGTSTSVSLVTQLRRRWEIPVVFLTTETDESDLRAAGAVEPFGQVVKPVSDRDLGVTIELMLCRHDATKAVHEMEDRFFAVSIDMLCFLGFNGYFKRLNPAWERALGFTRAELLSRPFIEFVHPDDRERTLKQNADVRQGGKALAFENRYLCKDGSYRWLRWNAAPDSDVQVIYSVARDITDSKRAEQEREQLVRELQSALAEVQSLRQILPICSYCRKVRDDENYWHTVEGYISRHTSTRFSHGICPDCMASEVEPDLERMERG